MLSVWKGSHRKPFPLLFSLTLCGILHSCQTGLKKPKIDQNLLKLLLEISFKFPTFFFQVSKGQFSLFVFQSNVLVHFWDICICSGHWEPPNGHITPGKASEVGGTRTLKLGNGTQLLSHPLGGDKNCKLTFGCYWWTKMEPFPIQETVISLYLLPLT